MKIVAITMVRLPAIQLAHWEFSSAVVFEELLSIIFRALQEFAPYTLREHLKPDEKQLIALKFIRELLLNIVDFVRIL